MIIVYLPPDITLDDLKNYNSSGVSSKNIITEKSFKFIPVEFTVVRINKSYKGGGLLVYEVKYQDRTGSIEKSYENYGTIINPDCNTTRNDANTNTSVLISSQAFDKFYIKNLYTELNFQPISQISLYLSPSSSYAANNINIFGVVLSIDSAYKFDSKCCCMVIYDFDINITVQVRLWRGLAAWINSLSIGCRLQIRNLLPKPTLLNELHSISITEVFLLGHGHLGSVPRELKLSARVDSLNFKEREILGFLNHQSLQINYIYIFNSSNKMINRNFVPLSINFPLNLEWRSSTSNFWILTGRDGLAVRFVHFDAKVWQILNEAFLNQSNDGIQMSASFEKLNFLEDRYEFIEVSSVAFTFNRSIALSREHCYKQLAWEDLISCSVVLFGLYEIEGIIINNNNNDNNNNNNNNNTKSRFCSEGSYDQTPVIENSIGNLSILPNESIENEQVDRLILQCGSSKSYFIYLENTNKTNLSYDPPDPHSPQIQIHLIFIKTILNDGNVNEIVRKSVRLY